ncbi:MAG: hypothetical protein ACRDOB_07505 [Streptosporangiaceae bacterium]
MRRLAAARTGAVITAVLACMLAAVLAVLAGVAWGRAGSPHVAASPPAAGSPVPASALAPLTELARRAAAENGDTAPESITAVLTTQAKALTSAAPGSSEPGAGGVRVYLVTMRGHFIGYEAITGLGAALPSGGYLFLVVDARTFRVMVWALGPFGPRVAPASLGPVTYLADRGP